MQQLILRDPFADPQPNDIFSGIAADGSERVYIVHFAREDEVFLGRLEGGFMSFGGVRVSRERFEREMREDARHMDIEQYLADHPDTADVL